MISPIFIRPCCIWFYIGTNYSVFLSPLVPEGEGRKFNFGCLIRYDRVWQRFLVFLAICLYSADNIPKDPQSAIVVPGKTMLSPENIIGIVFD